MAKRNKILPARKQRVRSRDEESLLMRSAESLGRMIGSLQRQLDGAGRRLAETANDVVAQIPDIPLGGRAGSRRSGGEKQEDVTTGAKKAATRKAATRKAATRKAATRKVAARSKVAARKRSARKSAAGSRKTRSVRPTRKATATRRPRKR